jgi:HEAT repeat protein
MALQQVNSRHHAQRLISLLALGFLRDAGSVPLLTQQLTQGSNHEVIHAGRALLEVDAPAHAEAVVQALLAREGLNLSLVSVMFKPFRRVLGQTLQAHARSLAAEQGPQALRCLRLARALRLQWPLHVLNPFLGQTVDPETLMAAIRLVQGEEGGARVAAHATHPDWQVRAQVARALGYIGGPQEVVSLTGLVTDAQWWVRYRSVQSLLRIPGLPPGQARALVLATGDRYAMDMLDAVMAEARA